MRVYKKGGGGRGDEKVYSDSAIVSTEHMKSRFEKARVARNKKKAQVARNKKKARVARNKKKARVARNKKKARAHLWILPFNLKLCNVHKQFSKSSSFCFIMV